MAASPEFIIEKLDKGHDLSGFNCGNEALNVWLKRFALMNVANDTARVYVAHRSDGIVAGYHALVAGLAVAISAQGRGLGVSLLQDALLRTRQAADTVGIRAVLVHAIDAKARGFYLKFGFSPSSIDDMRLMLLMKDLRAFLRKH